MWPLLKAEIAYNTQVFLFILLTSVFGFMGMHFWPVFSRASLSSANTGYIYLALTYFFFVMAILVTSWAKEKRARQLVCLPVTIHQIGAAHGFLHLVYWFFIVALFFVWTRISAYFVWGNDVFLAICVLTGVSWLVYSLIVFTSRFPHSLAMGFVQIVGIMVFGFAVMAGIVHNYQGRDAVHRIDNFLSWFLQSPASAALWMGLGIGATGIVLALPRLRSYVQ